jgi:hypothetical protein
MSKEYLKLNDRFNNLQNLYSSKLEKQSPEALAALGEAFSGTIHGIPKEASQYEIQEDDLDKTYDDPVQLGAFNDLTKAAALEAGIPKSKINDFRNVLAGAMDRVAQEQVARAEEAKKEAKLNLAKEFGEKLQPIAKEIDDFFGKKLVEMKFGAANIKKLQEAFESSQLYYNPAFISFLKLIADVNKPQSIQDKVGTISKTYNNASFGKGGAVF